MNLRRGARLYYLKFVRQKGDPHSLALATAIGVFIGFTPTMPLHTVAIILISFFTKTSIITAFLASNIACNFLTYAPIYYLSTVIGNALTPYELTWDKIKDVLNILLSHPGMGKAIDAVLGLGYEAMVVLMVGGVILALPFGVVSYFLAFRFFLKIRQKRREKHLLN